MKKVILLRGLPASGKSTLARQLLDENKGMYKRLNKDELRAMLDNSEHSKHNEKFVERVRDLMLVEALRDGKHVIIDDTNLSDRPVERIRQVVQKYCKETGEQVQIEVREMNTSLEESLARDEVREKKVGRDVILRMYKTHVLGDERGPHYQPQDPTLPPAILCDLDGTLAILRNRSPYDTMSCELDDLNQPIAEIIKNYYTLGVKIILMSGREEKARTPTLNWLKYNNIPYHALYMRTTGDMRKDAVVKKELYEAHVKGQYFVQFVLDDRNQVVDLWRLELGLPCLQVNYGDF
ncbi:phosphatase domain-containing protein [Runella aurantiaca]|uniref:Polynucleotide kinase n=1 Tax=Runella aurantiaca TaxID=2282308 RepID=A0A369IDF8_9BACT|nr:AAA family ATPase [Runella aurantiaca]RDB06880.1 polynucleotide kinase [Runella aurantiaca]